jgi:hypothetical protein
MKTLIKITALALLAALAVFSCAPEANLTGVDWNEVNAKYNPEKNSLSALPEGFALSGTLSTAEGAANELIITFPATSDFLKAGNDVEAKLREFLSFHHFTKATAPVAGKADTLGDALTYTFVRQNVNVITVKLTKTFAATDSSVVMKVDGTKYTFAGGNKLDLVNRGKSGEAGYDDFYSEIDVSGSTGASDFIPPGNKGWYLYLTTISSDKATLSNYVIAHLGLDGANNEIAETVANQLKSGLKIQKYSGGAWADVSASIEYFTDSGFFYLRVASLSLEELVPYRVMWEGSVPVLTAAEYYGVKQYIEINGANTPSTPASYQTAKVYGPVDSVWSDRIFNDSSTLVKVFSKDSLDQNVVIDVLFNNANGIKEGSTTHWLQNFNSDKQTFKENFKIVYRNGGGAFTATSTDAIYIDIKDFEFFSYNPNNVADIGLNAVRITLDPNYKINSFTKYFYISDVIRYTDNKTTFGDPDNFMAGFFKAYPAVVTANFPAPRTYIPLTANVWADGNIATLSDEQWFEFDATVTGNQYIHFSPGTASYVYVQLYDSTGSTVGSQATLSSSNSYTSQSVTEGDTYYIKVSYYIGTGAYQIAFNTSSATPPIDLPTTNVTELTENIWANGDLATSSDEQWFKFDATASTQYIHFSPGTASRVRVQLYDSDGNAVGSSTELSTYISRSVTYGNTYYIKVSYSSYTGTYRIGFNTSSSPAPITWPLVSSTTLTENVWEAGNITVGGEQWFKFDATTSSYQCIHFSPGTASYVRVQLYDGDGNAVGSSTAMSSSTLYISRSVTEGDTYYIRVSQYSSYTGTYLIAFNTSSTRPPIDLPTSYTTLTENTWANGNISTAGGEQWFKFDATVTEQYIHFSPDSLTDVYVQLYDSDGNTVGSQANLYGSGSNLYAYASVTEDDTYYIRVWPSGDAEDSGTYQIAFSELDVSTGFTGP